MSPTSPDIGARVQAQYETFPYPRHSLLLPLRTQEAYASNSLFAARLLEQQGRRPALRADPSPKVLLAGCGDVFPYMAAHWEPRRHRLTALDLSVASLRRARLRCFPLLLRSLDWRQGNLEDPDTDLPAGLSHVDCYGVLHHLADPARTLRRFGEALLPGGTARIMVYNPASRRWIRQVQKAFALLGLSAFSRRDRQRGRDLLRRLAAVSPAFGERLAGLGAGSLDDASRFVDTFFHAREAGLDLVYWLRAIAEAGLFVSGVLDRCGELDDLPNPLLEVPRPEAWEARIADRRVEDNFVLYLSKPGPDLGAEAGEARAAMSPARLPAWHTLHSPPKTWFEYAETRALPARIRIRLWRHFLRGLSRPQGKGTGPLGEGTGPLGSQGIPPADSWASSLPPEALQRLGRIGALFPADFRSRELQALLRRPRHDVMEPPTYTAPVPLAEGPLRAEVETILRDQGQSPERLDLVMRRLESAQSP